MAAKKTDILQVAVGCLERNDIEGFKEALARAKAACTGDERLEGEILLLSVVSGVVASDDMLETLLRAEQMIGGSSSILTPQAVLQKTIMMHFCCGTADREKPMRCLADVSILTE